MPPQMGPQGGCSPDAAILLAGTGFNPCDQDPTFYDLTPTFVPRDPCVQDGPDRYNMLERYPGVYDNYRKNLGKAEADKLRAQDCGESFEWLWLALALTAASAVMWMQ
jgi:hypothetical protein